MSIQTAEETPRRPLSGWQVFVLVSVVLLLTLGLAVYSAAASYESVSGTAAVHHVPLPRWAPLGLDGGLLGVIIINIALTWGRMPMLWVRAVARGFALGTIAANAAAGWPDPVGVGLRVGPVSLFVVLVEIGQAVLLRRHRDKGGEEGIPFVRWLLAPRSTFRLWRRMKLWEIRDYRAAIGMELERLHAIEKLSMLYGAESWRSAAPRDLVWMLLDGVRMDEALNRVAELTAEPEPEQPSGSGSGPGAGSGGGQPHGSGDTRRRRGRRRRRASSASDSVNAEAAIMEAIAKAKNEGREITGADIAREVGVSEAYVSRIRKKLSVPVPGPDQADTEPLGEGY